MEHPHPLSLNNLNLNSDYDLMSGAVHLFELVVMHRSRVFER
jgi:hypothetical protein